MSRCAACRPAGDKRKVPDSAACSKHDLKYKPRAGDALLFYSLHPDNSIDTHALHGGCPVAKGTKWVVTKWLHNRPLQVNAGGFGWR
jgi:prolyl 4-hydroxylase